jgi:hypothetical protein
VNHALNKALYFVQQANLLRNGGSNRRPCGAGRSVRNRDKTIFDVIYGTDLTTCSSNRRQQVTLLTGCLLVLPPVFQTLQIAESTSTQKSGHSSVF